MNWLRRALPRSRRPAPADGQPEAFADVQAAGKRFIAKSLVLRAVLCAGFLAVMAVAAVLISDQGGVLNIAVELALAALAALYSIDTYFWWKSSSTELRKARVQERGSTYTNDLDNLPNTNYLLAELRKEMPRARLNGVPFVLVHFSLESLLEVRAAYGEEAGAKAIGGLIEMLTRTTRSSDFFAHLGEGRFCSMLNECTTDLAVHYFKRIPKVIQVQAAGGQTLELPITARLYEYDLEAVYATDAVGEVQHAPPVPGWEGGAAPLGEVPPRPARPAAGRLLAEAAPGQPLRMAPQRGPVVVSTAVASPPTSTAAATGAGRFAARMAPQRAIGRQPARHPLTGPPPPIPLERFLSRQRAQAPAVGLLPSSVIPGPWNSPGTQPGKRGGQDYSEPGNRASAG